MGNLSLFFLFSIAFTSCYIIDYERDYFTFNRPDDNQPSVRVIPFSDPVTYWGNGIYTCKQGEPVNDTVTVSGADLVNFEGCLHLKIKVREKRITRDSHPEVRIDGKQMLFPDDFITGDSVITREICGKIKDFTMEIRYQGEPGNPMDIWIEGIMKNPVTDPRDGNKYPWVKIGRQIWMAGNLAYLPSVNLPSDSSSAKERYYVYGYSGTNVSEAKSAVNYGIYGILYNWPAAMGGKPVSTATKIVKGICPYGWHLPDITEWLALRTYLFDHGYGYEGNLYYIAKSLAAKTGWNRSESPGTPGNNPAANNSTGFTALPAGGCFPIAPFFFQLGERVHWWSSSESESGQKWSQNTYLSYNSNAMPYANTVRFMGISVRCIRN